MYSSGLKVLHAGLKVRGVQFRAWGVGCRDYRACRL